MTQKRKSFPGIQGKMGRMVRESRQGTDQLEEKTEASATFGRTRVRHESSRKYTSVHTELQRIFQQGDCCVWILLTSRKQDLVRFCK